jgi:hypothetical protein
MSKNKGWLVGCVALFVLAGCKDEEAEERARQAALAERAALKAEIGAEVEAAAAAKAAAEKKRAEEERAAARQDVVSNPAKYLATSGIHYFDKGIINSYRDVDSIVVTNNSSFPVKNLVANLEWSDQAGNPLGSVPATMKGTVAAGESKTFTTASGTLQTRTLAGAGVNVRVTWSSVSLADAK